MRWPLSFIVLAFAGAGPAAAQEVTFTRDIAPILYKNCAGCHRPGEVGPFPLLTYKDAAKRARHIKQVTASRRMPIWKPVPGWGEFHGERRLSDQDIALLGAWADSGAREGNPADLPPQPKFPEGWPLGEPDMVITMAQPFELAAGGGDVYRNFGIPTNMPEDKWVVAFDIRPGNRKILHHCQCLIERGEQSLKLAGKDGKPGWATEGAFGRAGVPTRGRLGAWVPGVMPVRLPEGTGRLLPKGANIVLLVHYHPNGKPEADQTSVALYFAKKPVSRQVVMVNLAARGINIPAGEKRYHREDSLTLPTDIQVIGIVPHMHYVAREIKATATLPDGTIKPLLWITDWDFNWQAVYMYREKFALPKGTKFHMESFFDNSTDNHQNPNNPPKRVWGGEATTEEMCTCTLLLVPNEEEGYALLRQAMAQHRARSIGLQKN